MAEAVQFPESAAETGDERLAILRMVAEGKVRPQEALELLGALQPAAAPATSHARAATTGAVLRVHCEMDEKECDFSVPLEAAGEIAQMLPPDMAERVPPRMLQQLSRLVRFGKDDDLLRFHEDDFELVIRLRED